jgi:hypothetical protein
MNIEENKSVITKKELMSAFWRSYYASFMEL